MRILLTRVFKSDLLKNASVYLIFDTCSKLIPFLILPILTHYLNKDEIGIINNFTIYQNLIIILVGLNSSSFILANYFKISSEQRKSFITQSLLLTISSCFICILIIFVLASLLGDLTGLSLKLLIFGCIFSFFQSLFNIRTDLFKIEGKAVQFGIYQLLFSIINFGLSLILIIQLDFDYAGRIWGIGVSILVMGLISLYTLFLKDKVLFRINRTYLKELLIFGLPLIPHSLSFWIRNGIDRFFITTSIGLGAVGIYSTSFQLTIALTFITWAFNSAYVPFLYKSLTNLDEQIERKLVILSYSYMVFILLLSAVLAILGKYFVIYFFDQNFYESTKYLLVLFIAQAFNGIYLLFTNYLFFYQKTKVLATITFSSSLFHVIISNISIKYWGLHGASFAYLITSAIICIGVAIAVNKSVKLPWFSFIKKRN